ncbi:MAG: PKD domain-containing protein [Paludibacter sp.]|nr:PKD domain-containing protein [Paludibacter sp.]
MKFFKLILFLLVTNTILGQSYWTFKQKPLVPISNLAVEPDDTVSTTNLLNTSTPKRLNARAAINTSGCIDNIDFEMGNFTNWKCYKGSAKTTGTTNYTVWSPTTPVAPVANRHQIISAASLPVNDMYGGFPRLCPNGGNYSVQLGNNATGAQAEKISCSFTIPADQNNFQIEYYYAVVFQDPNHPFDEQPRFQAKVYDANNSSNIINCASYDFTAASGLPGFKVSGVDPSVLYKPWSAVTINLSGYAGHTVILEFTTEDCTLGAHFGYAYIDVSSTCVSLTSSSTYCKNTPSLTLNAPSGYEEYNWYNSSYTKLLGTGQTLTLTPPPTSDDVVNVDLVPYPGFGCRDTAYTVLKVNPSPIVAFNSDSTVCVGKPISFTNNSSISDNSTLSYFWDFGDNTTSTSTNYTKTYNSTGTYKVRLISTSINGCTDSIIRYVTVGNLAVINPIVGNKNICVGQNESLFEATTGGTWRSTNPSVATITDAGLLTAVSGGIDTIRYIVSNKYGCTDSVSFFINTIVNTNSITNASICKGDTYTFNGTTYNTAGTYTVHLVNVAGCDSTATLNLLVKLPTTSTSNALICQGDTYTFNGTVYNASGTYTVHLVNVAGCDSTATLNLSVKLPTTSITNASISQGYTYTFNGIVYSAAGTYTAHLLNIAGCDSIATLNLSLKLPTSSVINASICKNEAYSFNGKTYSSSGTYSAHLLNSVGSDSLEILNLTVKLPTLSISNAMVCQGESYRFNDVTYTKSGSYLAHLVNSVGCDSLALLVLKINKPTTSTTNLIVSSTQLPYVWNKMSFNETGIHTCPVHFVNSLGCDSTATLVLTVKTTPNTVTTASICEGDSYLFNGVNYSKTGIYDAHLISSQGIDSIATLNLTVNSTVNSYNNILLILGESYTINGHVYTQAGTYTDILKTTYGCDSTVVTDISTIKIPNTITPNGDGYNDVFMKNWHVKIYNRNGILLFEGQDGWDGTYNNRPVSKDTYFYVLYYTSDSQVKTKEGYLMVIR